MLTLKENLQIVMLKKMLILSFKYLNVLNVGGRGAETTVLLEKAVATSLPMNQGSPSQPITVRICPNSGFSKI